MDKLIAELAAVLALVEKATEGPWRASEHCSLIYNADNLFAASAGEAEKFAIAAAINFLRAHGPELGAALRERDALREELAAEKEWSANRHAAYEQAFNQAMDNGRAYQLLRGLLVEARKWLGDGEHEGMHRSVWTPAYTDLIDSIDAALASEGRGA